MLNAKKEADKIFIKKQELQAQKAREEGKTLQDVYIQEMVGIALKGIVYKKMKIWWKLTHPRDI